MESIDTDAFGVNCSFSEFFSGNNTTNCSGPDLSVPDISLPPPLREISKSSLVCVFAYCVVFLVATSGNVLVLRSLWRRYKIKETRVSLLLLHLTLADLIVCCTLIPTEVFWRLTIQWRGGNFLCKLMQFCRAFGLYLSSFVLICVSADRFSAIIYPMKNIDQRAYQRIKTMLLIAWLSAALSSTPQAIFFRVETHPEFPTFKQCVTSSFLDNSQDVQIYSIFSVAAMYIIPLATIIFTYSAIILKLIRKSRQQEPQLSVQFRGNTLPSSAAKTFDEENCENNPPKCSHHQGQKSYLRVCVSSQAKMSKAKTRTLLMTVVIVVTFVLCWTPYAVMTMWYMIDWEGAQRVDPRVQDALFLMAVANSCINPLIYGGFAYSREKWKRLPRYCFH